MSGIVEQLLVLCNQLVVIGADEPKVLIAGMLVVAAVAITIVVCCVAIICCIPYTLIMCLVKLCRWLWRRKHPVQQYANQKTKAQSRTKSRKNEVNYMPQPRQRAQVGPATQRAHSAPVSDLPPVYPDWMHQKSGRLL